MKKAILLIAISAMAFVSCKNNEKKEDTTVPNSEQKTEEVQPVAQQEEVQIEGTVTYIIADKLADCTGVGPMKCMQIKESKDAEWQFMYQGIEGFEYEEGFEYVVEVKRTELKNPPADAPSIRYTLVKLISKEKK
ncbi:MULTISPECIES: DUF4377 domain-containing protein [Myroides]|uniref:DUF4377 domain-containing protein n=1 Tax=Myroides albus TaxID=2562892 RepID=A0A6I3LIZ0_9FLAO|nr:MULTISPECIES: DUF4377 domain-containing protein [Myroides]MTG97784.1 DUF4377 domain-containing protein [Myroides albus]MVX34884.1 DUF4377 domain-containing protein [Myroides sp. LoEW2-1]UVD79741.1 DUF4377 domain-containing protein [Myroides albus]